MQGGGKSRQGGSYAEQDGIALNRAGRHCVLTGSSWIPVETGLGGDKSKSKGVNALNPSEKGWAVSEEALRCD